ncbi:MAG: DNA-directed RNA polymerase subunit omega, partial [Bacteroidales bacterium]|nr:DNA-directed RNA polymerase subunit omega [Bacteroidales bacterium]
MEKKNRPTNTTITRDTSKFSEGTNNIYETVAILSKRANQIASDMKRELHKKIEEFSSGIDTMEDVYE